MCVPAMAPKTPMKAATKATDKPQSKPVKKDAQMKNNLTEENMNKHNDILKNDFKDTDDVAKFIKQMPKNEQMILWKRFLIQF